jgi:demethylmenaquinone methyltransferase/2-methoxy-6-polyprenyl-1,4-benzoquinol methylase
MEAKKIVPSRDHVAQMFDSIGKLYDVANRCISFGIDPLFRRALVKTIPKDRPLELVDIATGTCDQLLYCLKKRGNITKATGIDVSKEMLKAGLKKVMKLGYSSMVDLKIEDGQNTSFADLSFDVATLSFGIRNFKDPLKGLQEIHRILKKGGSLHILEFSTPLNRLFKGFFLFYIRHILPKIGAWITSNLHAYQYLHQTIETFAQRESFVEILGKAGFIDTSYKSLFFGIVTIYTGRKP